MSSIQIVHSYNKEDLRCAICLEYLNNKIFQCTLGPHYVCGDCNNNIKLCPICRNNTPLVRFINLEQELHKYLTKCEHYLYGCDKMIFNWDDSHKYVCKFRPINCPICNKEIENKINKFIYHLMDGFCNVQFDKTSFIMKKPKFKCTLKTANSPTIIEVINRYIIVISPQRKNQNYKIMVLSLNDKLFEKKIKCKINSDSVTHEITLPIVDFHHYTNKYGLISFPVNDLVFIFEDLDFIPHSETYGHKQNINF